MDIHSQILLNIRLLEEAEWALTSYIREEIIEKNKNRSLLDGASKELLQHIHSFSPAEKKQIIYPDGNWINATDGITVLSQLIYNSNILLDLQPNIKTNQQFISLYGFSVKQLLQLARQRKITLNLIGYESNKDMGYKEYLVFEGTAEEERAYANLFLLENGMRINSIRRKLFFDLSLNQKHHTYDQFLAEGNEIFKGLLELPSGELNKIDIAAIFRVPSVEGLIQALSHQYAYNKTLSILNLATPYARKITDAISYVVPTPDGLLQYSEMMRGLKVLIASPLLGPMGGTYSMSYSAVASLRSLQTYFGRTIIQENDSYETLAKDLDRHRLSEKYRNRILSSILKRKEITPSTLLTTPAFLTDKAFQSYLRFIDDIVPNKKELDQQIDKLTLNPYLNESRLDIIDEYMVKQGNLLRNYEKFSKVVHSSIEQYTPMAAGFLLGHMVSNNILLSISSGFITAFVSKVVLPEETVDKAMRHFFSNKHQLLLSIEGLKKLVD